MRGFSLLIAVAAQLFAAPATAQQSFELPLTSGAPAKVVGIPEKGVMPKLLREALDTIKRLHAEGKLEPVRTKLFIDHNVVKTLLREPHAIVPLAGGEKLAVSLLDGGHVIIPHAEWKKGEVYAWLSAPEDAARALKAAILPGR